MVAVVRSSESHTRAAMPDDRAELESLPMHGDEPSTCSSPRGALPRAFVVGRGTLRGVAHAAVTVDLCAGTNGALAATAMHRPVFAFPDRG